MIEPITSEYFRIFFALWVVVAALFADGLLNGAIWAKGYDRRTRIPAVRIRRAERPRSFRAWMTLYGAMSLSLPAVVIWTRFQGA